VREIAKMRTSSRLLISVLAVFAATQCPPASAGEDRDTQEVQAYVLTNAGLAKYEQATRALAALPAGQSAMCADEANGGSIAATVARLNAAPGVRAALQAAGMTPREYVVFSFSLLQHGLAAWALKQPGGKLPAGVSRANVDFVDQHQAQLQKLEALKPKDGCGEDDQDDEDR
jgi:hypothetical protein